MDNNTYYPNHDEVRVAFLVAKIRNENNGGQSNLPGGEVLTEEQRLKQHFRAALAEIAVSRLLNLCWTGLGKGSTGLKDVGNAIEVRSITNPDLGLLIREKDALDDPFVLVLVGENRICRIIGWAYGWEIKKLGWVKDADTDKPAWILPNSLVRDIATIKKEVGIA